MAIFSNNDITDLGRGLLADVQMGAVFTPTRIVIGSGFMPNGVTPRTITSVVNPVKSLPINKKKRTNDGIFICGGSYSNADIATSFYFRELALYAKAVKADGTETAEVLYCYGNAGETADLMPAYSAGSPVERQIDVAAYIGNDSAVNLTIESGVFLTREQLAEALASADGSFIVIDAETTLPPEQRQAGYLYFNSSSSRSIAVTPAVVLDVGGE